MIIPSRMTEIINHTLGMGDGFLLWIRHKIIRNTMILGEQIDLVSQGGEA